MDFTHEALHIEQVLDDLRAEADIERPIVKREPCLVGNPFEAHLGNSGHGRIYCRVGDVDPGYDVPGRGKDSRRASNIASKIENPLIRSVNGFKRLVYSPDKRGLCLVPGALLVRIAVLVV